MKVLLALDSSPASQHVVHGAKARTWPTGTVFCVLSVVDVGRWERHPALVEEAKLQIQPLVRHAADQLIQSGHEAFPEVKSGFPKKLIPEYAKRWGADLMMVGSHGQGTLTRFLLGSVAQSVLRTSPCSVEVVRHSPPASQGMRILLASDGSACSAKAVSSVANRPWPAHSEIRIISVVQLLTPDAPSSASPVGFEASRRRRSKEARCRGFESM
jgi:nucleotide-binding universal stress UspA family protein